MFLLIVVILLCYDRFKVAFENGANKLLNLKRSARKGTIPFTPVKDTYGKTPNRNLTDI